MGDDPQLLSAQRRWGVTVLLIEPHLDDAVLFASYTILGEKPIVCTVMGDTPDGERRIEEHREALGILGAGGGWEFGESEQRPNWRRIASWLLHLRDEFQPTIVYSPAREEGGHEQHNRVTEEVEAAFSLQCPPTYYMTYVRGGRRSRGSIEVEPEHGWAARKFQAMACYASQIEWVQTRPWFAADDALREWLA